MNCTFISNLNLWHFLCCAVTLLYCVDCLWGKREDYGDNLMLYCVGLVKGVSVFSKVHL